MDIGSSWPPTSPTVGGGGDGGVAVVLNSSSPTQWDGGGPSDDVTRLLDHRQRPVDEDQAYRDFTTTIQVFILIGSLIGNATVLWCTCCTNVFKAVTSRFVKNLACSGLCASLACVPFDVALGASPRCCWWLHTLVLCKAIKFLHRLFCSVTVLSFAAIALDRYYSVLYPLERKISDARSRDLVVYIWAHAVVVSVPVFAVTNVTDVYATASCSDARQDGRSLGHLVYVLVYNVTTVILPLALVFFFMVLIRRALSASQKKKVIIAALRTPQSSVSIPYVSQREAELHAALLAMVLAFAACAAPYGALVVYRAVLAPEGGGDEEGGGPRLPPALYLTAVWLPKVSLLTNPLLFLTVNRSARRSLADLLARARRRYSRRNAVNAGGGGGRLASLSLGEGVGGGGAGGSGGGPGGGGLEMMADDGRSGSQLLEMFNIGQQQIFRPSEEEEEEEEEEGEAESGVPSRLRSGARRAQSAGGDNRGESRLVRAEEGVQKKKKDPEQQVIMTKDMLVMTKEVVSPLPPAAAAPCRNHSPAHHHHHHACSAAAYASSSSQVAPAATTPTAAAADVEDVTQFGFGPFELPPQWLPETRNSKKRLLPPLGNTPEELIQTKQTAAGARSGPRPERRISRNNKVSTIPTVDP